MKTVTTNFKSQIKKLGRQFYDEITYTNSNNQEIVLHDELFTVNVRFNGGILKSIMKELEILSAVELEKDTLVNYKIGLLVNGDYEYIDYGNYIVYNVEKEEDTDKFRILCYDKMLYSMKRYERVDTNMQYPMTLRDYINAIADKLDLVIHNRYDYNFPNSWRIIHNELYLDNEGNDIGYTFRDVLDDIAEATASTICINDNDELELRYITDTLETIDSDSLKDVNVKFGEMYGPVNSIVLSRSGESDNVYMKDDSSINQYGLTEVKIIDNQIMNGNDRADYLNDIYATLHNLTYSIHDYNSTGILYLELCDRYNVEIGENTYSCVMLNDDIERKEGLQEVVFAEMPEDTETDYTKADKDDRRINQTYLIVDKQNQQINAVINKVDGQDEKIATISASVDELNVKIRESQDITITSETMYATMEMDGINQSEPITIKVRPNLVSIKKLYPKYNLYPSNDLYLQSRTLRFHNTTTDEIFDYELPDDLLYLDNQIYDEFKLDYDSETCQIIKRCELNSDGTVRAILPTQTIDYPYPTISLTDGDYEVSLLGYNYGYIYARLMASNQFTSQFATKVELQSSITQTKNEINLTVSEKLDEEDFTHASIVAKINDDTSQVLIDANKINITATDVINVLAGNTINLTSKTISITSTNFSVTPNGTVTMQNANVKGEFANYDSNGYLAVKISRQVISLYDWRNNGIWTGSISSTYTQSTQQSGIALFCQQGDVLTIGYKTSESDTSLKSLMAFDTSDLSKTPWIKNTSSGNVFADLNGGGIVVENGIIKTWNLNGIKSGTVGMGNGSITVTDGLITDWQSTTGVSGTVKFKSYLDGWIANVQIQNGLIVNVTHERE